MAKRETQTEKAKQPQQTRQEETRPGQAVTRREGRRPAPMTSPFGFVRRMMEDMDRMFEDFGFGRLAAPRWQEEEWRLPAAGMVAWAPDIEVFQSGDRLVVRADLPGLKKEDVKVQITGEGITLEGERRVEREETVEGFYRSEREYGRFSRLIPLPEGADLESTTASMQNGVLEISVRIPETERKARTVEVRGDEAEGKAEDTPPAVH